jgi:hypothetical protein
LHTNLLKLWDKGIDITANVITSVIVALIGLAFWRAKLWLDLRAERAKRLQDHRMDDARAQEFRRQESAQRYVALCAERDGFIEAVTETGYPHALADIWDHYLEWLVSKGLDHLPRNIKTIGMHSQYAGSLRAQIVNHPSLPENRRNMENLIRGTELPKREP